MKSRIVACLFAVALVASVRVATATPITYQTPNLSLTSGTSVSGTLAVNGLSFFDEAEFADFWTFSAVAGQVVDLGGFAAGSRLRYGVLDLSRNVQ